ncbi:MAG: LPS translocon maturation chaperone LptM [Woeseiaceae bacterium]
MTSVFRSVAAVLWLMLATACGQKGPLYLPGDPQEEQIEIPGQPSEEGADEDEQDTEDQSAR